MINKPTPRFWHQGITSGNTYPADTFHYVCPKTGELLNVVRDEDFISHTIGKGAKAQAYFHNIRYGNLQIDYPNNSGVWQWKEFLLPGFPEEAIISLNEGKTDQFQVAKRLRREIGLQKLFIKMEGQSPSESFKDRGMTVAISDALRLKLLNPDLGIKGVMCASTGDTSASAAIFAAECDDLECIVLLPHERIADTQLYQAIAHGAKVIAVKHPQGFDGCMQIIQQLQGSHPEYVLVNSKNDMRLVGQETIGLEIAQDFGWQVPDWIAIPVGNGGNLSALMLGLLRAKHHGLIDRLPKIIAAQAERANPLYRWQQDGFPDKLTPGEFQESVASAMNINMPVSFPRIRQLYKQFEIRFTSTSEEDIKNTWARFTRAGANVCPQSAVALHGVIQCRESGDIKEDDTVVAISTASGIKFSAEGIMYHKGNHEYSNPYQVVEGSLEKVNALM